MGFYQGGDSKHSLEDDDADEPGGFASLLFVVLLFACLTVLAFDSGADSERVFTRIGALCVHTLGRIEYRSQHFHS